MVLAAGLLLSGSASAARAQGAEGWPSLQGGPDHAGSAPQAPAPPLRAVWRTADPVAALSGPAVSERVIVAVERERLVGLDPATGRLAWSVPRALGQLVPPALASEEGGGLAVYVEGSGAADGALVAVGLADRARAWRVPIGGLSRSAPTVAGGSAYVGSRDGFLYAVDLATGDLRWRAKADGEVDVSPAVAGERVFVVGENRTTGRAALHAFDAASGRPSWPPVLAPAFSIGASSPVAFGDAVAVGFGDGMVRAYGAATGDPRWEVQVRGGFSPMSSPAFADGDLFVADVGGGLYRLDGTTGRREWEFQFPAFVVWGSPLAAGPVVYLGMQDGTLAAVDAASGHRVWRQRLAPGPVGPLAPAGGRLLAPVLGRGGGMVALETDPGGILGDEPSPSELRPGVALLNYGAAFAAVMAIALIVARIPSRRRPSPAVGRGRPVTRGGSA